MYISDIHKIYIYISDIFSDRYKHDVDCNHHFPIEIALIEIPIGAKSIDLVCVRNAAGRRSKPTQKICWDLFPTQYLCRVSRDIEKKNLCQS